MQDASGWTVIGGQAGSMPAALMADAEGRAWYVKSPPSDDHARNELLANRLYRLAGAFVAEVELVRRNGALAVASAVVRGASLGEALSAPDAGVAAAVCRDFAVDAWLGNRDVLGADLDNVLVTRSGAVVRIDQGGALAYRARGAVKTDFGPAAIEFDTLRDPRSNAVAASVFGAMTPHALATSVAKVTKLDTAAIDMAVRDVLGDTPAARAITALLIARRDDLARRVEAGVAAPRARRLAAGLRTSATHPLQIAEVRASPAHGRIGITFCPGKHDATALTGGWARDLAADLDAIRQWGAALVITLVEPSELALLRVPQLGDEVQRRAMQWLHLPIPDYHPPTAEFERRWAIEGSAIRQQLRDGHDLVVHCKGGLGRAGMIAARLLVELGVPPTEAIARVRQARGRGAIETRAQQAVVERATAME
ncbi:cyclin-dependent kinase inhibitor 3 family protein [Rhodopseudomonas sp.]|uniref:cyclin-dependent kinase inhibitor 3 family protein n=1 Tax=Rhodopseudomonas sp. TaxID=1078 RepID=UPI003B3AC41A